MTSQQLEDLITFLVLGLPLMALLWVFIILMIRHAVKEFW